MSNTENKTKKKNRATGDGSEAKAFATKNYDRTSIPRTHKWMERTDFQKLSSDRKCTQTHACTCTQNKQNILIIWFWSQWLVDFDYMLQEFFFLMALPAIFSLKDCFLTFCSGSSISDTENEAFQPMRGNEYLAPTWTQHDAWLTGKTMNRIFWE